MTSPKRLTTLPSWLAGQAAQRAARLVGEALGEEGFRRHHFAVMTALAEDGAASQAELGRRVWLDRSDLHAVLNELERDGLVARKQDERDRRRNLVELTPAGVKTLKRLDARVDAAQEEFLAPLNAAERGELLRLLAIAASGESRRPSTSP
jgi:MarR family transcriptional regulator, lower aerobic nicotinate degradation pathway regulator